jgi:predicted RNA binding protein YcfA (HicA-like mRNA interferase family)
MLRGGGEPSLPQAPLTQFPSLKARALLAVLSREPLNYRVVRQVGSHRRLEARDRPSLTLAFHERTTIAPGLVRKILVDDVGLSEEEARRLI